MCCDNGQGRTENEAGSKECGVAVESVDETNKVSEKGTLERYILSVSLSNPIGELVSSAKLFDSKTTNQNKSAAETEKNGPSHHDQNQCHKAASHSANIGEKEKQDADKDVDGKESRDFVFRIVYFHNNSSQNTSQSSTTSSMPETPLTASVAASSIISHFSFSQAAILRQKNLLVIFVLAQSVAVI